MNEIQYAIEGTASIFSNIPGRFKSTLDIGFCQFFSFFLDKLLVHYSSLFTSFEPSFYLMLCKLFNIAKNSDVLLGQSESFFRI
jgi:hypothetical protein